MHFLFQLLLVAFILVHARAMRHAPKTGINTPQFVEGGFSVILHEDLQDYHLEALKLHVQDVHHSEEYGDKVGMVSKTFTKAFKVSALFAFSYSHSFSPSLHSIF